MEHTPVKSSLSEARDKVSYHFFKDIYETDLKRLSGTRKTYRGFHIYAVDGDDLDLPASKSVLQNGYRGYPYAKKFETYYPKMYTVYAYDVMNGLVHNFAFSSKYQELNLAVDMTKSFEKNSVTIYDRYYSGFPLMNSHYQEGNYFLIRVKTNGKTAARSVKRFIESGTNEMNVDWYSNRTKVNQINVRLVKIVNPKTNKSIVLATNLSKEQFTRKELFKLYEKRWEIETSLSDLTHTLKMSQWHSKKVNGILQEIFALLWFVNNVKIQMMNLNDHNEFLGQQRYAKSNFKLCARLIIENIALIIERKFKQLGQLLAFWIARTKEYRKHHSRSYPRIVKGKLSKFPVHSKIRRRETA